MSDLKRPALRSNQPALSDEVLMRLAKGTDAAAAKAGLAAPLSTAAPVIESMVKEGQAAQLTTPVQSLPAADAKAIQVKARLPLDLHRRARIGAAMHGVNLDTLINLALEQFCRGMDPVKRDQANKD